MSKLEDGAELAGATNVLAAGLDTPNVPRYPLALKVARYAGEWVAAVVADSRALAEDAAEAVAVEYEPLPFVLDADEAYAGGTLVHEAHGSNVLLDRTLPPGKYVAQLVVRGPSGTSTQAQVVIRVKAA